MVTLTGFADEISRDLHEQLDTMESEAIRYLEFRGVWGTNVLQLSDDQLDEVQAELNRRGMGISSIGSPLGKIGVDDDFEAHMQALQRAIDVAQRLSVPFIRIFSFFIPKGDDPAQHRDEVLLRLEAMVRRAEEAGIVLLHENEKHIYGDTPERCLDIMQSIDSDNLRCAFDPANFIQCQVKPYTDAYEMLEPYITYMHIKDALLESGKVVPAGEGDGEFRPIFRRLKENGYSGYMSLEPHLAAAGTFSGFSGPDLYKVAAQALKKLLHETDIQWE